MNSSRVETPSFAYILLTWARTVPGAMNRLLAISALRSPSIICRAISNSLALRLRVSGLAGQLFEQRGLRRIPVRARRPGLQVEVLLTEDEHGRNDRERRRKTENGVGDYRAGRLRYKGSGTDCLPERYDKRVCKRDGGTQAHGRIAAPIGRSTHDEVGQDHEALVACAEENLGERGLAWQHEQRRKPHDNQRKREPVDNAQVEHAAEADRPHKDHERGDELSHI